VIKRLLPFLFAGVLGVAAVMLMQNYLQRQQQAFNLEKQKFLEEYKNPVQVIVARRPVPEGRVLTTEDLGTMAIPEKFRPAPATANGDEVLNMQAKVPFAPGEPILRNKIQKPTEKKSDAPVVETLAEVTPQGKRAVTIEMDTLTGVGGFIAPGDNIDILWTFANPDSGENSTLTIFQEVLVLAVNDRFIGEAAPPEGSSRHSGRYTLTLSLAPEEASMLLYARQNGQVQLSLRSKDGTGERMATFVATKQNVLKAVLGDRYVIETPERKRQVEVYKGLDRNTVPVAQGSSSR